MTNEEYLKTVGKDSFVFMFVVDCMSCQWFTGNGPISWKCKNPEKEKMCRFLYKAWLEDELETEDADED